MRTNCNRCGYRYSDYTSGRSCVSKYCYNKNICESCSIEINTDTYHVCSDCRTNKSPTTWYNYIIGLLKRLLK